MLSPFQEVISNSEPGMDGSGSRVHSMFSSC